MNINLSAKETLNIVQAYLEKKYGVKIGERRVLWHAAYSEPDKQWMEQKYGLFRLTLETDGLNPEPVITEALITERKIDLNL